MVKSTRFLSQFIWANLAAIVCFAMIVVVGCYVTGVPQGANNLFRSYYSAFPLMELFILYFYGFALCTNNLNLALAFGAKRRDFFWGIQGVMLLYTAACWLIQVLISILPRLGGWTDLGRWGWVLGDSLPVGTYPFLCVLVLGAGGAQRAGDGPVQGWRDRPQCGGGAVDDRPVRISVYLGGHWIMGVPGKRRVRRPLGKPALYPGRGGAFDFPGG